MRFPSKTFLLGLGLLAWGPGWAQEEAPPLQVNLALASGHVFRGVERAGDSAQAAVELNRDGWRAGVWINQPLDHHSTREVNLNAGYAWCPAGLTALEVSATHTWFDEVPGDDVQRSFEVCVNARLAPVAGFTPGFAYSHDFRFQADTVQVSLAHSIALTRLGAFLELNFFAGWTRGDNWRPDAPGPRRGDSHGYWGGELSLPYRIGPHATVVAGLHYAGNSGRSVTSGPFGRAAGDNLWVTLGVNLDF